MTRKAKLHAKLELEEAELRRILLPALEEAAAGGNTLLFVTRDNNPWPELREGSATGNEIVARAKDILTLAGQLGVARTDLIAAKVIATFESANDLKNANRLGPLRLAQQLLAEIGQLE